MNLLCTNQVMQGYLNAPAKTAETLLGGGWLRTGDVVTMDDDGYVYMLRVRVS